DRRALPEPPESENPRVAPRTPAELTLHQIWSEVLKRSELGVTENFFDLGGDSILSLQIIARARENGLLLSAKQVFEQPTIAAQARVATAVSAKRAEQRPVEGEVPLTPIQARFFERHPEGTSHWNQSVLLRAKEALSVEALERTLVELVRRHDALRLRFVRRGGRRTQQVADVVNGPHVEVVDLRAAEDVPAALAEQGERVQRSLDIVHGPLLRAAYFRLPDGESRLLLAIHHLAIDGVSWRVLLDELEQAYAKAEGALPFDLPAVTTPFSLWAARLAEYAERDGVRAALSWWKSALSHAKGPLFTSVEADLSLAASREVQWELGAAETRRLLEAAPRAYRMRIDEVLLTALVQAIGELGRAGALVDLEGHGREDVLDDLDVSRTVGWFTSRYPVWLDAHADAREALVAVKERLRAIPDRGLGWGLLRHSPDELVRREATALPVPAVSFNYLGQFDRSEAETRFGFASESAGSEVDTAAAMPHALAVNGLVAGGELSLSFRFRADLSSDDADRFVRSFDAKLRLLLEHCAAAPRGSTASDFPLAGLSQGALERLHLRLSDVQDLYPATPLQQGLLFHTLAHAEEGLYVYQLRLRLAGTLDERALREAWQTVVARHDVLRTSFVFGDGGRALQVVHRSVTLPYAWHDWTKASDYEERLSAFLRSDVASGFDVARPPLLRVNVFARPDGKHDVVWTMHHALADGWSSARLVDEVVADYGARISGRSFAPAPTAPYRDYVAWLAARPSAEAWWRGSLATLTEPARLLPSLGRVREPSAGTHHRHERLDGPLGEAVRELGRRCGVTPSSVFQAAWAVVLGRYGDRRQAIFGATVSGRPPELPGAFDMTGLFINTLPVWIDLPAGERIGDWLRAIQRAASERQLHEHTPLSSVQQWLGLAGDALFDTLFVFENFPVDAAARSADVGLRVERSDRADRTHYALTLTVEAKDHVELEWEWDGERVEGRRVEALSRHLREVLEQLVGDSEQRVGELMLSVEPKQSVAPREHEFVPVLRRIGERARSRQDSVGLRCEGEDATYGSLWAWSNRVGRALQRAGVRAESLVGLCVERSVGLVAGLLGIWKAGG
ncbi:MAG TPA: condensation domain-containing protein, partial [Polyangiaceae bacterium]|nr:condensation domain-containing protein [Polyangiaceae bacterium]